MSWFGSYLFDPIGVPIYLFDPIGLIEYEESTVLDLKNKLFLRSSS